MASRWRKYNDKSVEPATYEQMEEDAYGSKRTCSAYCIVYTRCKSETALFGSGRSAVSRDDRKLQFYCPQLNFFVSIYYLFGRRTHLLSKKAQRKMHFVVAFRGFGSLLICWKY